MKKVIVSAVAVVLALCVAAGGIFIYVKNMPEYALLNMVKKVEKYGFESIEEHMTENAKKKIEPIMKLADNNIINSIVSLFSDNAAKKLLLEKVNETEWSLVEVLYL